VKTRKKDTTKKKPAVLLFLAQPAGTLIGDAKWQFRSLADLCRWAVDECGFEGFTAPPGGIFGDVDQILQSRGYADDLQALYQSWGGPLCRFENHVDGQMQLIHPAQLDRLKGFSSLKLKSHREYETAAETRTARNIMASAKMGFDTMVDFSGNRGYCAVDYPWPAYPPQLRMKILLLLYLKHRSNLKLCARLKVKRCFELHAENDLRSPYLLYLFREIAKVLDPEVADWIKANADASHPTLYGDNAAAHFRFLYQHDLLGANHLKDGEIFQGVVRPGQELHSDGPLWLEGGSIRGDYGKEWSKTNRRFTTFGTGQADWDAIAPILAAEHDRQPHGLPLVVELECSKFPNMKQGAKIAADNARRIRDGKRLLDVDSLVPETAEGGNWEEFAEGKYSAEAALAMDADEVKAVALFATRLKEKKGKMVLSLL